MHVYEEISVIVFTKAYSQKNRHRVQLNSSSNQEPSHPGNEQSHNTSNINLLH